MAHHRGSASQGALLRGALIAACLAGVAAVLAPWPVPALPGSARPDPAAVPDTLAFAVRYGGTGEGIGRIWRGQAAGPVPGRITVRMEYAGDPRDRRMPTWPVNAWLLFSADDPRGSFAAELSGTMNWNVGEMRVAGLVSDGARHDTALEYRMRVIRPELHGSGELLFYPRIASARLPPRHPGHYVPAHVTDRSGKLRQDL